MDIIERTEEILNPDLPIIERIGRMARICYKVEGEQKFDVDCRIIKKCIKEGHESILEHGAISVFINPEITEDAKKLADLSKSKTPYSFDILWRIAGTDAQSKYIEDFSDPELFSKFNREFNTGDTRQIPMPCKVGDVRAWRQVIRERIYLASGSGDQCQYIMTLKLLEQLDKVDGAHILFGDIVEEMNKALKDENVRKRLLPGGCKIECPKGTKEGDQYTLQSVCDYYFKVRNSIYAAEASSCASMSVIITTDRATTHQLVRHRKNVAYSQESQRYVNYGKKGCRCVEPCIDPTRVTKFKVNQDGTLDKKCDAYKTWKKSMETAFDNYNQLLELGLPPESARGVLPNDTATVIGVTWLRPATYCNLNFWRLDQHAQYSIRTMLFRIMLKAFELHHPYMETMPFNLSMNWLKMMKDQNVLPSNERIDKMITFRKALRAKLEELRKQARQEQAAEK